MELFSGKTDLEDVVFGSLGGSEFLCETPTQIHSPKVKKQTKSETDELALTCARNYSVWSGQKMDKTVMVWFMRF